MSDEQTDLPNPNAEGQELEPEQSVPIDPESLARHYEQDDVAVGSIVRFGIAIAVGATVAVLILWFAVRTWSGQPANARIQFESARVTPVAVPGPGLDAAPENNWNAYLQRENERLHTYGWIDREAGVARIPIDEAMRLLAEQGVAAREGDVPTFHVEPAFTLDSSGGLFAGEWMAMDELATGDLTTDGTDADE